MNVRPRGTSVLLALCRKRFAPVGKALGRAATDGTETVRFTVNRIGLTALPASKVDAPLIGECYASFECRLADASQIAKRGLFIWDVVKAHVAPTKNPETPHYCGKGVFRLADGSINRRRLFKPDRLE